MIFRFWKLDKVSTFKKMSKHTASKKSPRLENSVNFSNLGEVLATSIMSSINTVLLIGGLIVLFSVIIPILNRMSYF